VVEKAIKLLNKVKKDRTRSSGAGSDTSLYQAWITVRETGCSGIPDSSAGCRRNDSPLALQNAPIWGSGELYLDNKNSFGMI
jgi:hypothetical protein